MDTRRNLSSNHHLPGGVLLISSAIPGILALITRSLRPAVDQRDALWAGSFVGFVLARWLTQGGHQLHREDTNRLGGAHNPLWERPF
jgi:hypothetical protein